MEIFVAGATGVLGRRAVPALLDAGHRVSAVARTPQKADAVRAQGATPVTVDLFDAPAVADAVAGHDVVVNLATHIPPSTKGRKASAWVENDRLRTEASANLVAGALAGGASRYVQESIAFLYGEHGDEWLDESTPLMDAPFTAAVATAEAQATRFAEGGGTGVVLRFGMFYAADAAHTVEMVRLARRGWFALPGRPDAYQPLVAADDAGRAVAAALRVPSGTYNVVEDEPSTRAELAAAIASAVGRARARTTPKLVDRAVARVAPNLVASQRPTNRAFREASGWAPAHPSAAVGFPATVAELEQVPA